MHLQLYSLIFAHHWISLILVWLNGGVTFNKNQKHVLCFFKYCCIMIGWEAYLFVTYYTKQHLCCYCGSQFMHDSHERHLQVVNRVFQYLNASLGKDCCSRKRVDCPQRYIKMLTMLDSWKIEGPALDGTCF